MITLPAWSDDKGSSSFFFTFVYVSIVFLDSLLLALVSAMKNFKCRPDACLTDHNKLLHTCT